MRIKKSIGMSFGVPTLTIKSTGSKIPVLGFGSGTQWRIAKTLGDNKGQFIDELSTQVQLAIDSGFNHIDTAEVYHTHEEVGKALEKYHHMREKLWITDKYFPKSWEWRKCKGPLESVNLSLKTMNLKYYDLYMLHSSDITKETAGIDLKEAWRQMEEMLELGLTRNIGVSNFTVTALEEIKSFCRVMPTVNQIEFSPYLQEQSPGIFEYCAKNDIIIEAYSPLAPLSRARPGPLDDILPGLTAKYNRSETQILLRWAIQRGVVVLTTSSKQERLKEILGIFDFELEESDVNLVSEIGSKKHYQWCLKEFFDEYRLKVADRA